MIPAFIADRENRKRRGEFDKENRIGAYDGFMETYEDDDDDVLDDEDEDDIVYETKGGSPPAPASPMSEANAQIELERARAQIAAEKEARQQEIERIAREQKIAKARGVQSQAYDQALGYGQQQVGARGFDSGLVDKYGLLDLYGSEIDTARLGIAEDDLNPMSAYNTRTNFNNALETALGTYRGDLRRQLNTIAPEDMGYNMFADTADDSILQEILDSARADAMSTVDAARARGQLNDVGYSRALSKLDQQGESSMATLQDLGLGVLSGYRDDLSDLRNSQLDRVNSADFTSPYSFDTFQSMLTNRTNDLNNRMRGDLFRATDGKSFFDPSTIISSSGALQGYYNPTSVKSSKSLGAASNPLLDAFVTDEQNKQKTGISSNGIF